MAVDRISQLTERVHALEYELQAERDARERDRVSFDNSVRELEERVQREGKRADGLESDQAFLFARHKETSEELAKARDAHQLERQRLEETIRGLREQLVQTEVEYEDAVSESQSAAARASQENEQLSVRCRTQAESLETMQSEVERLNSELRERQQALAARDEELEELRNQAAGGRAPASSTAGEEQGSTDEAEALRAELSELLTHTRAVENAAAKAETEVKTLREQRRLTAAVEEEKNSLASRVQRLEQENERLGGFELRVLDLEQERKKWALYLDNSDEFNSPEDMAKALVHARLEAVRLKERIGELEEQLAAANTGVDMSADVARAREETEDLRLKLDAELQNKHRLQTQCDLLGREVEMLTDQLKSYQQTEGAGQPVPERLAQLEKLLEEHKSEAVRLRTALAERDGLVAKLNSPKRPRSSGVGLAAGPDNDGGERLAEQMRKTRNLQAEVDRLGGELSDARKEVEVLTNRLHDAEAATETKHRILELRANPTAKHEAIKREMLEALRKENEDLLAVVQNNANGSPDATVPASALERSRADLRELERTITEQNKRMTRLKEVFSKKSLEFREAVFQLLGYRIDLLPSKKVRVSSVFASEDESFTFLADSKGKKFVGIEKSPLASQYDNLVTFWIKERNDIPCFLAAINLELYENTKGRMQ